MRFESTLQTEQIHIFMVQDIVLYILLWIREKTSFLLKKHGGLLVFSHVNTVKKNLFLN